MVAVLEDTARTEKVGTVDMEVGMTVARAAVSTDMTNLSKHIDCVFKLCEVGAYYFDTKSRLNDYKSTKKKWDLDRLPRFEKNLYKEHPNVKARNPVCHVMHVVCLASFLPPLIACWGETVLLHYVASSVYVLACFKWKVIYPS